MADRPSTCFVADGLVNRNSVCATCTSFDSHDAVASAHMAPQFGSGCWQGIYNRHSPAFSWRLGDCRCLTVRHSRPPQSPRLPYLPFSPSCRLVPLRYPHDGSDAPLVTSAALFAAFCFVRRRNTSGLDKGEHAPHNSPSTQYQPAITSYLREHVVQLSCIAAFKRSFSWRQNGDS